jgi:hypothetical protein
MLPWFLRSSDDAQVQVQVHLQPHRRTHQSIYAHRGCVVTPEFMDIHLNKAG